VDVHDAAPAEQLFGGDAALDRFEEGPDLIVALAARTDIHMAAFARNRDPAVAGMDEAGDAEAGAGAEHGARCRMTLDAGADLLAVVVAERGDGKRLRLEVVDEHHV